MTATLGVHTWRVETTLPVRTYSKEARCWCAGCRRDLGARIRCRDVSQPLDGQVGLSSRPPVIRPISCQGVAPVPSRSRMAITA